MIARWKPSVWQALAAVAASVATLLALGTGAWHLLYCFVLPRDRGDAGPGSPPDVEGALLLAAGVALLAVGAAFTLCTIGAWSGRRWGFIGIAVLCALQLLSLPLLALTLPAWFLACYSALLAVCVCLAVAGARSVTSSPPVRRSA